MPTLLLPIQIVLIIFIVFAASRALLRFKAGSTHFGAALFWLGIWTSAILATLYPEKTTQIASAMGIGRGADVIIYTSIVILFYLSYRLHALLEDVRTEISNLVREVAIQKAGEKDKKEK